MFKKTFLLIKKIFVFFILPLFLIFEFYYYTDFGENRELTGGEMSFLKSIYDDTLEYNEIKVFPRKFFPSPLQNNITAMSPNGNIYFPKEWYFDDFSKESVYKKAWLVHEACHAWQYKKRGQFFAWEGAYLILKNYFFDFDQYKYEIEYNKKLTDYNMEQQCDILKDYFLYLNNKKVFNKKEVKWYLDKVESL